MQRRLNALAVLFGSLFPGLVFLGERIEIDELRIVGAGFGVGPFVTVEVNHVCTRRRWWKTTCNRW